MNTEPRLTTGPDRKNIPGGIFLCAFPAIVFYALYVNDFTTPSHERIPAFVYILLSLCFIWGLWAIYLGLFPVNPSGLPSALASLIMLGGMAAIFLTAAWTAKDGWTTNIPFLPDALTQAIPRLAFALFGVLISIFAIYQFCKALKKLGKE